MHWNFDISQAPKGGMSKRTVVRDGKSVVVKEYHGPILIAASKCGKVTVSRWLHEAERWEMFEKGEQPIAWMPWPTHPSAGGTDA